MTDTAPIDTWLAQLSLDEKCRLLGGASSWRTHPIERLGIPVIKMTDGPNGARGEFTAGERTPAVAVPVGVVQGATWDAELIGRVGDLLGREARRRAAHVLLAPAVNLQRTPVGGRNFEYLSEDPELTAALAVATVRGVQGHDVAVTVKHYVANDTEIDRQSVDVSVDERVLREIYLRPFEATVRDAGAWGIMTAYNKLDGEFCAAHDRLLNRVLRDQWGFDGFVVSDWFGAHDTVASATGGLSIEMPGPSRIYGDNLARAVKDGLVDEATIDALVRDVLVLIERTRATERPADAPETSVDDPAERALCREVAVAGTVLARNERAALPLHDLPSGARVAVIGPNAATSRTMGGGSSALFPLSERSILDALRDRLPGVIHETGCLIDKHTPLPAAARLVGPDGEAGLELRIVNGSDPHAEAAHTSRTASTLLRFFGSAPPGVSADRCVVTLRGAYVPAVDGTHQVGVITTGPTQVAVADTAIVDLDHRPERSEAFFGYGSAEQFAAVELQAGEPAPIDVVVPMKNLFGGLRVGIAEPVDERLADRAVDAARQADAAIVVVGTTDEWESEGYDRDTIALPGDQDELIRRVAAANDRTIVVVNAGAPVAMPWIDDVEAILIPFFGGMEMAEAVADIVLGDADPGGRLPITFPKRLEDAPAWAHHAPVDGVQTYGEGFGVGYRGHDRSGVAPLFAFGHGLSYGEAEWGELHASATTIAADGTVSVTVPVTATGDRDATVVVQGYVAPIDPPVEREPKALRTWAKTTVRAGTTEHVELVFDAATMLRRWDVDADDWTVDPGAYDLLIGSSAQAIHGSVRVHVAAAGSS